MVLPSKIAYLAMLLIANSIEVMHVTSSLRNVSITLRTFSRHRQTVFCSMIAMVLSVEVTKAQASTKQERVQLRSQGGRLDDGSRNVSF